LNDNEVCNTNTKRQKENEANPNPVVPDDCMAKDEDGMYYGYPSADRSERYYTKADCDALGGTYVTQSGMRGVCKKGSVSLTDVCATINTAETAPKPTETAPASCKNIGVSSVTRSHRLYTQYECEDELGGQWDYDEKLSLNNKLGTCAKSVGTGSWSTECRALNYEYIDPTSPLPPVPGEKESVIQPPGGKTLEQWMDQCVSDRLTRKDPKKDRFIAGKIPKYGSTGKNIGKPTGEYETLYQFFPTIDNKQNFVRRGEMILLALGEDELKSWEWYGYTYEEMLEKVKQDCSQKLLTVDYEGDTEENNLASWWKYVGDKWNSPCPQDKESDVKATRYQTGVDLDRPVCKQWRVRADHATRRAPGPLDEIIPPSQWRATVNTKWVWQHATTTGAEEAGLYTKQPCPFPEISNGEPMDPADCFLAEKAYIDIVVAGLEKDNAGAIGWFKAIGKGGIKAILAKGLGLATELFIQRFLLIPEPLSKWAGQAVEEGVKMGMDAVYKKIEGENPEVFKNPQAYLEKNKNAPAYEDEALKKAGLPAYIPAETWEARRTSMIQRRTKLIEQLNKTDPSGKIYEDKFGYDINNPYFHNMIHGGNKKIVNSANKVAFDMVKDFTYKTMMDIYNHAEKGAHIPKGTAVQGAGHKPHAKFAEHLRKLKVSPEEYLAEARRKAKAKGLAYKLLGWADDGTHKLQIPNEEGRLIQFGSAGMGDHILYTLLKDPTASAHRKSYLARATKIRGDWKKSPYSPNSLAIAVLW
jgi:hypothetical protein